MITFCIFAAGRADSSLDSWNNHMGHEKHFIKIGNETILERTVRLINLECKNKKIDSYKIIIIAKDEKYKVKESELFLISKDDKTNSFLDRIVQVKSVIEGDLVILYGDVWYSEDCIQKIVGNKCDITQWFHRPAASKFTNKNHNEDFSVLFKEKYIPIFFESIEQCFIDYRAGTSNSYFEKKYKGPLLFQAFIKFCNKLNINNESKEINTIIDDFTEDFDTAEDYKDWITAFLGNLDPVRNDDLIHPLYDLINYINVDNKLSEKILVEVGSYIGESSEVFCKFFNTVYCVDTWEWYSQKNIWKTTKDKYPIAERNFDYRLIPNDRIKKIKKTSLEACELFEDYSVDVIYIDAMHDYESVLSDIIRWKKKVKPGGFICGHDYTDAYVHFGVIKAVDEIFGKPDYVFSDTSWAVLNRIEKTK